MRSLAARRLDDTCSTSMLFVVILCLGSACLTSPPRNGSAPGALLPSSIDSSEAVAAASNAFLSYYAYVFAPDTVPDGYKRFNVLSFERKGTDISIVLAPIGGGVGGVGEISVRWGLVAKVVGIRP